jgi:Ni/Fe-hydrogenase subunit HybB-like protein
MIPDFGTLRDRAQLPFAKYFYGMLSLGWRGSTRHWIRYETASLLLAGLSTPLVLSVHTVISFDFAVAALAGWHTTIFPPYFVAGAVYSGFAMVLTLAIPIRKFYHVEDLVTLRHLDNMAKVMLATGSIVAYGYGMEVFMAWYSASHWEFFMMWNRMFGPMWWGYWLLILTNIAIPLTTLWSRKLRVNVGYLFILSFIVNIGMWFERFVIVVTSLYREYLPSSWGTYKATKWDYMTFIGTWGLFTFLFLLFVRFLPMIPMSEIRMMLPQTKITRGGPTADTVSEEMT